MQLRSTSELSARKFPYHLGPGTLSRPQFSVCPSALATYRIRIRDPSTCQRLGAFSSSSPSPRQSDPSKHPRSLRAESYLRNTGLRPLQLSVRLSSPSVSRPRSWASPSPPHHPQPSPGQCKSV